MNKHLIGLYIIVSITLLLGIIGYVRIDAQINELKTISSSMPNMNEMMKMMNSGMMNMMNSGSMTKKGGPTQNGNTTQVPEKTTQASSNTQTDEDHDAHHPE